MVRKDILFAKADAVKKHLKRLEPLAQMPANTFLEDIDAQDIALFNIQLAIQNCIDIAAHVISDEGLGVPGSTNEMFYCLEENGYIDRQLTEKMVRAVGFRNLVVHEYGKLDLQRAHQIVQSDVQDLNEFLRAVFRQSGV